ncbi:MULTISPECIES: hypothetical protein [Streptomyces]|uniref:hypothetical protein n=1 Tax=Streptomyces TaxID=1883 RepID=UPI00358F086F
MGGDPARFADTRGLKAYAGAAPITRASENSRYAGRRRLKNNRLHDAGFLWPSRLWNRVRRSERSLPVPGTAVAGMLAHSGTLQPHARRAPPPSQDSHPVR